MGGFYPSSVDCTSCGIERGSVLLPPASCSPTWLTITREWAFLWVSWLLAMTREDPVSTMWTAMVRGPAATASVWAPAPSLPMVFLMLGTGTTYLTRRLTISDVDRSIMPRTG